MPAWGAAVLQLAHLCTLGCCLPLAALSHTNPGWINHPEEEHGRKKASSSWDADRLESLCTSLAANLLSKVKFGSRQGLSISPCATHCFLSWEQICLETFSFCLWCYDRDAQASVCRRGVDAGHSWCWVMQEEMWLLALCLHISYFSLLLQLSFHLDSWFFFS